MTGPVTRHGPRRAMRETVRGALRNTNTQLNEELPVDHRLSTVYRIGAGLIGSGLIFFGVLGLTERLGVFATEENTVLGLGTNGALSILSLVIGALLLVGMVRGGNFASTLNIIVGIAFLLSGFVNLALLETPANILNFGIQNVLFSFAAGLVLLIFGMYGRVAGRLPRDNPYFQSRHPEEAVSQRGERLRADRRRELMERVEQRERRGAGHPARQEGGPPGAAASGESPRRS
jgi:hypothetical protein